MRRIEGCVGVKVPIKFLLMKRGYEMKVFRCEAKTYLTILNKKKSIGNQQYIK